jgi:hypothetical protein
VPPSSPAPSVPFNFLDPHSSETTASHDQGILWKKSQLPKRPYNLVQISAELHLFDPVEGLFMLQEKEAEASVDETAEWECT